MPRIKCLYEDCKFIDDGFCSAAAVEFDPNEGCRTYATKTDLALDEDWNDDEDLENWDEVEEEDGGSDDDDLWLDNDDF